MSDFRPQAERAAGGGRGHETFDIQFKGIVISAISLGVVAVVVHVGLGFAMDALNKVHRREQSRRPALLRDTSGLFPRPNLQTAPALDMARFRRREMERLNSYGWTDEANRLAHIPIERAISLVVSKGLPTRDSGDPKAKDAEERP